jgi:intraflagellar transport protein 80
MIQSLSWNDSANMLTAIADSKFTVWYYPNTVFVDRDHDISLKWQLLMI